MTSLAERLVLAAAEPHLDDVDPTTGAIEDAALREFELFGVARTTMADISRRAKIARVTVYRRFPGKGALIDAVLQRELGRFLKDLDQALEHLDDVEERFVEAFIFVAAAIRNHRLLQRVLESEPETIVPHLTVQGSPFIAAARDAVVDRLTVDLKGGRPKEELSIVADILVRLMVSYLLTPVELVDLDDLDQARGFARRYLLPVLAAPTR